MLRISEIFYSIQGEGVWVGTPMIFIRLFGCLMKCSFCDTKYAWKKNGSTIYYAHNIVDGISKIYKKCKTVCITGGEPFEQNLEVLHALLRVKGYRIHIETNGSIESKLLPYFNWITVSPKRGYITKIGVFANEVKCVIKDKGDFKKVKIIEQDFAHSCPIFLQPCNNDTKIARMITEFVKDNPRFRLGYQLHKTYNLK